MSEDRLRRLLSDAVRDIEPVDRIEELRASVRPSPKVVPMARSRSWYAATGIVATAAVIGVVAYLTQVVGDHSPSLDPADGGTAAPTSSVTATDSAAPQPTPGAGSAATVRVYYLGHGPRGDVLFREPRPVPTATTPLATALFGLMSEPYDPDYRSPWQPGWLVSARLTDGLIRVEVGAPSKRPASMSARTASEIVQSAVYTFQAATHTQAGVVFERAGRTTESVLGVSTSQPVTAKRVTDVLSLVNITRPALDGARYRQGHLVVTGSNNGFEAAIRVRLIRHTSSGDTTMLTRTGRASGAGDPTRLYPWRVAFDTSHLAPGTYTIVASNDDPSGRGHPATDTREIVLR